MRIWKKIFLGFFTVVIIMMAANFQVLRTNNQIIDQVKLLEQSNRVELTQSNKIAYAVQRIKSNLRELFIEYRKKDEPHEIARARQVITNNLPVLVKSSAKLKNATKTGLRLSNDAEVDIGEYEELFLIDSLNKMISRFSLSTYEILDFQEKQMFNEAELVFKNKAEIVSRDIQKLITLLAADAEEEVIMAIEKMNMQVDNAIQLEIISTVLSVLLVIGIGAYISRSISNPLKKLIHGANEVGKGNLKTVVNLHTKGELQILAESFNKMAKELKVKISSIDDLNKVLQETNDTKDTFFSIIAHDLINPFNIILGYADLLSTQYNDFNEDERKKHIELINSTAKKTFELLQNLLTWSRSQSGKLEIKKTSINLYPLITEAIASVEANANKKKIEIINKVEVNTQVIADKFTLLVILNNAIHNAVKFTPDQGKIIISAYSNNKNTEVCIKDSGVGMSQETIKKLLISSKGFTLPGTNNESGTGLGMILIKDFIEKNHGQLKIESELGHGSSLKFYLPA
jgi:signal transduction histidine kinase